MTLAALAALEEAQRCLLRYQLETLAFPTREATGEDPVVVAQPELVLVHLLGQN